MSRTKKLIAVGALALAVTAAATGPALASRHTTTPPSEAQVALDTRHVRQDVLVPDESRHTT